ncbi:hypothetical protein EI94DRAFT_1806379 [Lactarius quietus]|nr:hypothetical protein EI94DRAFT_1806379 [Lactarius quietus]
MLVGSVSNCLNSFSGFCDGLHIVEDYRINSTPFIFATAVPALLTFSISEGINIPHRGNHGPLASCSAAALHPPVVYNDVSIHDCEGANPAIPVPHDTPAFDIRVWVTVARWLRRHQLIDTWPIICLAVTTALSHKECEHAAGAIKAAVTKVLAMWN